MNSTLELHPKTAASGLSACIALIILWALSYWVTVPPEVAAAFTALLGFAGAWLAPLLPKTKT
jgi:hypothetical protein